MFVLFGLWVAVASEPIPTTVSMQGTVVTEPARSDAELLAGFEGFIDVVSCPDGSMGVVTSDLRQVVLHRFAPDASYRVELPLRKTAARRLVCGDDSALQVLLVLPGGHNLSESTPGIVRWGVGETQVRRTEFSPTSLNLGDQLVPLPDGRLVFSVFGPRSEWSLLWIGADGHLEKRTPYVLADAGDLGSHSIHLLAADGDDVRIVGDLDASIEEGRVRQFLARRRDDGGYVRGPWLPFPQRPYAILEPGGYAGAGFAKGLTHWSNDDRTLETGTLRFAKPPELAVDIWRRKTSNIGSITDFGEVMVALPFRDVGGKLVVQVRKNGKWTDPLVIHGHYRANVQGVARRGDTLYVAITSTEPFEVNGRPVELDTGGRGWRSVLVPIPE